MKHWRKNQKLCLVDVMLKLFRSSSSSSWLTLSLSRISKYICSCVFQLTATPTRHAYEATTPSIETTHLSSKLVTNLSKKNDKVISETKIRHFDEIPGPSGIYQLPYLGLLLQMKPFSNFFFKNVSFLSNYSFLFFLNLKQNQIKDFNIKFICIVKWERIRVRLILLGPCYQWCRFKHIQMT